MSIRGEQLGWLLARLVADEADARMEGAATVTGWAGVLDDREKKIIVRVLSVLAATETDQTLREEQLNAIGHVFPFSLHTLDDIQPLLDQPLDFYGSEAAYITELVDDLEGMLALRAYRQLTLPLMAEDETIRAWQEKLRQADRFYAGIAQRPFPDRELPPRPDGSDLVELEVGLAALAPASSWEHHLVAQSRTHLAALRRLHRVVFRHGVREEVDARLPVTVEDVWVNDPMFGLHGPGWSLAVNCDWTLDREGGVVANGETEPIDLVVRSLVGHTIVRFEVDDQLVDPAVHFDDGAVLHIHADTDLDPWTFNLKNMPYVLVGRGSA